MYVCLKLKHMKNDWEKETNLYKFIIPYIKQKDLSLYAKKKTSLLSSSIKYINDFTLEYLNNAFLR